MPKHEVTWIDVQGAIKSAIDSAFDRGVSEGREEVAMFLRMHLAGKHVDARALAAWIDDGSIPKSGETLTFEQMKFYRRAVMRVNCLEEAKNGQKQSEQN